MADNRTETRDIQETVQQVFLAGLGALSKAEEEGSKAFQQLVQRGQNYSGPGRRQIEAVRQEVEMQVRNLRGTTSEAQEEAQRQGRKARGMVDTQVSRARQTVETMFEGVEERVERAVTAALKSLGVPTRDDIAELQKSLRQLSRNLDAARREQEIMVDSEPMVEARASGGGWYEIVVHGLVVDRVRGEDDATARVEALRASATPAVATGTTTIEVVATGGGWYEIVVDGVVVDKVQGRRAADAAVARLEQQA